MHNTKACKHRLHVFVNGPIDDLPDFIVYRCNAGIQSFLVAYMLLVFGISSWNPIQRQTVETTLLMVSHHVWFIVIPDVAITDRRNHSG